MNRASTTENLGVVASVRRVSSMFDSTLYLPPIYSELRAGADKRIVIEALAQGNARHVRGIAPTPTQALARGIAVSSASFAKAITDKLSRPAS